MKDRCTIAAIEGSGALLFDLDGVLVETEPLHSAAWRKAIRDEGHSFAGFDWSTLVGISETDSVRRIAMWLRVGDASTLLQIKKKHFERMVAERLEPSGELHRVLARLRRPTAVVTSSPREVATMLLERARLNDIFDTVVTADEVARPKPNPEPYRTACTRLGVGPSTTVAFEDSDAGARSAMAAGCRVVRIRNPVSDIVSLLRRNKGV
jgi:beta-phosphoglucomutase